MLDSCPCLYFGWPDYSESVSCSSFKLSDTAIHPVPWQMTWSSSHNLRHEPLDDDRVPSCPDHNSYGCGGSDSRVKVKTWKVNVGDCVQLWITKRPTTIISVLIFPNISVWSIHKKCLISAILISWLRVKTALSFVSSEQSVWIWINE